MIIGIKHGPRLCRVFSNILKCSIIVRGGIQPWGIGHRYHLSWRLWQPNLIECPQKRGKIILHLNRAKQYLYKLEEIMPDIKLSELRERGNSANKSNFPRLFNLRLNKFWFALHLLISLLGFTMSAIIIFIALSKIR